MRSALRLAPLATLLVSANACGGEDPTPPPAATPTLTRVQAEVFALSCNFAACHAGSAAQKGLNLEGQTHVKIVGVMSMEKPGTPLVSPGHPESSYLLDKISNTNLPTAPMGERWDPMPAPSGLGDADRIELVRAWIAAGAKDD